jgi:hypothetical protein
MPRLLVCRECKTIDQLPLYDGPKELESQDPILDRVVQQHVQRHGDVNPEVAALLVAPEDICICPKCKGSGATFWQAHQDEVLKGLGERWTGFHPEWYATKDTLSEDALRCYNIHRRPKGTDCIDWQADSRRLTPESWPKEKSVYLCHFCPVASTVVTEIRYRKGRYKKEAGEVD